MKKQVHYTIDKPNPETNIFILILKYLVLGISSVVGLAIILPLIIPLDLFYFGQSDKNKTVIYFCLLGAVTMFIFVRHFVRKFKLSKIYDIRIDNEKKQISFKAINNINGKEEYKELGFECLKVDFKLYEHPLYGTQREIILYDKNKLFNVIHIDLDGWNRTVFVGEMIEKILEIDKELLDSIESDYS